MSAETKAEVHALRMQLHRQEGRLAAALEVIDLLLALASADQPQPMLDDVRDQLLARCRQDAHPAQRGSYTAVIEALFDKRRDADTVN
ncbi:hypothetical protein [Phenylobacterium sp.]|uniref:hypothetical protein n=1 Tax=Phenylobacterium sp. TaxID=1871053 RepID=UPI0035AEACE0